MRLFDKYFFNLTSDYYFQPSKLLFLLCVIGILSLISCGPSIETMQKSIDDFNSRTDYYTSFEDLLKSQSPTIISVKEKRNGELNQDDKILLVKGEIEKTYFDIYQINNQNGCKININARSFSRPRSQWLLWIMIPRLFLFSKDEPINYLYKSKYSVSDYGIYVKSEMTCELKDNTIYYLLVCSDNSFILSSIRDTDLYLNSISIGTRQSLATFMGKYQLSMEKISE